MAMQMFDTPNKGEINMRQRKTVAMPKKKPLEESEIDSKMGRSDSLPSKIKV